MSTGLGIPHEWKELFDMMCMANQEDRLVLAKGARRSDGKEMYFICVVQEGDPDDGESIVAVAPIGLLLDSDTVREEYDMPDAITEEGQA